MLMWIGTAIETVVAAFITLIKTFYVVGRIIAYVAANIGDILFKASAVIADCSAVFYEDVKTFISDIDYQYSHFIRMLNNGFSNCIGDILRLLDGIASSIVWSFEQFEFGIQKMMMKFTNLIAAGAISFRDWIILVGDSAWLLVTCIPNMTAFIVGRLIGLIYFGTKYLINTVKTVAPIILNSIKDVISFLSSVPLQTICGLIFIHFIIKYRHISFSLFRVVIRAFKQLLYLLTSRLASYCHNIVIILRDGLNFIRRTRNYLPSLPTMNSNKCIYPPVDDKNDVDFPNFCVICQDQMKSIVLMPCRHLCLCENCYKQLKRYRRACPVCRQPFVQTIQVYT